MLVLRPDAIGGVWYRDALFVRVFSARAVLGKSPFLFGHA